MSAGSNQNSRNEETNGKIVNARRRGKVISSSNPDVTFIFPSNAGSKLSVEKHRFIEKSKVFKTQFAKSLKTSTMIVIPINDISFNTFLEMTYHLYGHKANITERNFIKILYASRKYCVNSLTYEVIHFAQGFIDQDNLVEYFEVIDKYSIKMLDEHMRRVCISSPLAIIGQLTTSEPHKRILQMILESSLLNCTEYELYITILKMLKREFRRLRKPIIENDFRKELDSMVYLIRFPLMTMSELIACGRKPSLLSGEELIDIQLWVEGNVFTDTLQHFSTAPRFAAPLISSIRALENV